MKIKASEIRRGHVVKFRTADGRWHAVDVAKVRVPFLIIETSKGERFQLSGEELIEKVTED